MAVQEHEDPRARPVEYVSLSEKKVTSSPRSGQSRSYEWTTWLRVIEFFERYAKHPEPVPAGNEVLF